MTETKHATLVQSIESDTNKTVTIETAITAENFAKCHSQGQSLFFKLPAELRNVIFAYATLPYDDPDHPYEETDFYYRPGHHARHRVCTSVLHSCRRAWLETNGLPMRQMVHSFWFKDEDFRSEHFRLDGMSFLNDSISNRRMLIMKSHGQISSSV